MNDFLQFILALPLALVGMGCFLRAMVRPGSIGMIRLSLFAFTNQFLLGPLMNVFTHDAPVYNPASDILLTFGTIYLFFLGVVIAGLVWNSRLDPVLMVRDGSLSQEKGIWSALTEASLRAPLGSTLFFYGLVTVIRTVMLAKYGAGLSGTATLEQTLSMPYWVLAIHKTFTSLGFTFVYVAFTKLEYRQRGGFWYILIIVTEVVTNFLRSRRKLFTLFLLMLFAWLMKHGRFKLRHAVLAMVGVLVLFKVAFPMFYEMRHQWVENADAPVSTWIANAWQTTRTGGTYGESRERYKKSFVQRLNALDENYQLAGRLNGGSKPAGGQFLKAAVLFTVPRFLWPDKNATMLVDDDLMDSLYLAGGADLVSNMPSFAMADFGLLGGLIYGLIFGLALRIIELMMKVLFQRSPIGAMALFGAVVSEIVLNMEFPPGVFMVIMRLVISIFLMFYLLSSIFGGSTSGQEPVAYNDPYPVPK